MFFGLCNSPPTFQTLMDEAFKELIDKGTVFVYMNDIVIATEGPLYKHIKEVWKVLKILQEHDLFLKPFKCEFHQKTVSYLGFLVGGNKVQMDPIKVEAIKCWKNPIDLKEVCSFLGFGNFYKAFIPHYSLMARPLHDLTCKGQQWHWGPMQQIAFNTLKHAFTTYPVLRNPDHNK